MKRSSFLLPPTRDLEGEGSALLTELRGMNCIYLSPHYDDACFSLAITIRAIGSGTIVNLFTRSLNVTNPELAAGRSTWTPDQVEALRDAEDAKFAAACGLRRLSLGLDDAPVRGRSANDFAGLADDRTQLTAPLRAALLQLTGDAPTALFCPAAIGRHVNHRATLLTTLSLLPELGSRVRLFFYEDLPYASSFTRRAVGVARMANLAGATSGTRYFLALKDRVQQKFDLMAFYASQHKRPPELKWYTPRAFYPRAPHEAFWELTR